MPRFPFAPIECTGPFASFPDNSPALANVQLTMAGYIHITRAGAATGTYGTPAIPEYQLTYVTGGNSFVRTFSDAGLEEFLASYIGLTADEAAAAIDRVRLNGNATISEVRLSEQSAAALGLNQLPSDY